MFRDAEAIPTEFDGVEYKSRTEARWAVFFDRLGVKFEYESKYFHLSDGTMYPPDFYVHDFDALIEVKPDNKHIVLDEAGKALELYKNNTERNIWLAIGPPDEEKSNILDFSIHEKFLELDPQSHSLEEYVLDDFYRAIILEDRKDEFVYWLVGHSFGYEIGGPGTPTSHQKDPIMGDNVSAAYKKASNAFLRGKIENPWKDNPFA